VSDGESGLKKKKWMKELHKILKKEKWEREDVKRGGRGMQKGSRCPARVGPAET